MNILPCYPWPRSGGAAIVPDSSLDPYANQPLTFADGLPTPAEMAARVGCFWTKNALLVLFWYTFRQLRLVPGSTPNDRSKPTPCLWEQSDVVEVFVQTRSSGLPRYYEFQVAPDSCWLAADVSHQDEGIVVAPVECRGFRVTGSVSAPEHLWRAYLEMPWSLIGDLSPHATWRCNFYRASGRYHGDELLAWSPTGYGERCFHRAASFGQLVVEVNAWPRGSSSVHAG